MDTDEKERKGQEIDTSLKARIIVLIIFALLMILLIAESIYGIRTNVKKIIQSSESEELRGIARKSDNKASLVLEECVNYIKKLENENWKLSREKEALEADIQSRQTEAERLNRDSAVLGFEEAAKYQLCCLFTGNPDGNGGAVYREGADDTITYMVYAPRSEGENAWEQYDRLEVDMYKRNGQWLNDYSHSISADLPDDIEEGEYHVSIFLRTDASRLSEIGQADQPPVFVNGGSVRFSVGDQAVAAQTMRLGIKDREGDMAMLVRGGEKIELKISPQDNTSFFSFAVCLEKNMP